MDKTTIRAGRERLIDALGPVLEVVRATDPADPGAAEHLARALPVDGPALATVAALVREGVQAGWLCEREADGVRFCRVARPDHPSTSPLSIDAVHMDGEGPGHTHTTGEIDLCFAVDGTPRFDGQAPGWVVLPPGSWHVPTVTDGTMDILYFLPHGKMVFGPRPA